MATHDYNIANDTAANVRSDLNNALSAIRSSNLSATAPSPAFAGLMWFDTTDDELKIRNESNTAWIVIAKFSSNKNIADTPAGAILQYAGSSAPSGWLLCDGSVVSRTTYADLFAAISTTYGAGNGSTTFGIPDLRGRVPVGSGQGSGLTNRTLGSESGAETHTLSDAEMPSHHHFTFSSSTGGNATISGANLNTSHAPFQEHRGNGADYAYMLASSGGAASVGKSSTSGSDNAHNNMQPFLVVNHIIKI